MPCRSKQKSGSLRKSVDPTGLVLGMVVRVPEPAAKALASHEEEVCAAKRHLTVAIDVGHLAGELPEPAQPPAIPDRPRRRARADDKHTAAHRNTPSRDLLSRTARPCVRSFAAPPLYPEGSDAA